MNSKFDNLTEKSKSIDINFIKIDRFSYFPPYLYRAKINFFYSIRGNKWNESIKSTNFDKFRQVVYRLSVQYYFEIQ